MSFLADMAEIVTENEPLGPMTYFGLGGPARWLVRPRTVEELAEVARRCRQEEIPLLVLGLGANLLVCDEGVDAVVVRLSGSVFRAVDWQAGRDGIADGSLDAGAEGAAVSVGGGADMARLTLDAVRRGLGGIEDMAGIPGTMGGIIRMNAGGRAGQIAEAVVDVTVVDGCGEIRRLTRGEVGFGYRQTRLGGAVVCGARLMLRAEDRDRLQESYTEFWDYKRRSQPLADHSAGCAFKNPPGDSAGRLIDAAGLKGYAFGGAYVSPQHANFILARRGAAARDVLAVMGHVRRAVAERFGVQLEREIQVWERHCARDTELAA